MKCILKEIADIISGGTPKTSVPDYWGGSIPWISIKDFNYGNVYINQTEKNITQIGLKNSSTNLLKKNDIIISARGTVGCMAIINKEMAFNQSCYGIRVKDENQVNSKYLYWYLKKIMNEIKAKTHGSVFDTIIKTDLEELEIDIPDIKIQCKISTVIDNITKKIMCNDEINNNLYRIGINVYNEKIVKKGEGVELRNFFKVITGKKDANASCENGCYPFFTCSKQISRINEYSFDDPAILLAGNGDFNVKVYKGKFDAYQRTYVLIPNEELYLGYLYFAISESLQDLTSSFRGSVIKFITKGMIENYKIPFINDTGIFDCMNNLVEMIRQNDDEIERLSQLRDILLPKLMNGEIDLDNVEI